MSSEIHLDFVFDMDHSDQKTPRRETESNSLSTRYGGMNLTTYSGAAKLDVPIK